MQQKQIKTEDQVEDLFTKGITLEFTLSVQRMRTSVEGECYHH